MNPSFRIGVAPGAVLAASLVLAIGCGRADRSGAEVDPSAPAPPIDAGNGVTIVDLGTLGGCCSAALGNNDAGQVVGWSVTAGGATHAFLWEDGVMTDLGDFEGAFTQALDIDEAGRVVGVSRGREGTRGIVWEDGTPTALGTLPGGTVTTAVAISDSGEVVGTSSDSLGRTVAARWDAGTVTGIPPLDAGGSSAWEINNRGLVVGVMDGETREAFVWEDGRLTILSDPGGVGDSEALGVNDAGQVVGRTTTPESTSIAVLWENGTVTQLELAGAGSQAMAINEAGQIAGWKTTDEGRSRAFLWDRGTLVDLGTLGGDRSRAEDLNDAGQVVGASNDAGGSERATMWIVRPLAPSNPPM